MFRSGENNFWNEVAFGVMIQPFQNFDSAHFWHLQIRDEDSRERKSLAVFEFALAAEVFEDLGAIAAEMEGIQKAHFAQRAFQYDRVVFVVLRDQDGELLVHESNVS